MNRVTAIAALLFAAVTSSSHMAQAGMKDGMAAYARGDYPTAIELLKEPASNGDKQAQALLGYMDDAGLGTEENDAEAVKWYENAALQGIRSRS
jgi:TPR repeat protein